MKPSKHPAPTTTVDQIQFDKSDRLFALAHQLQELTDKVHDLACELLPQPNIQLEDEEVRYLTQQFENEILREEAQEMDSTNEPEISKTKLTKANVAVFQATKAHSFKLQKIAAQNRMTDDAKLRIQKTYLKGQA
jgi:hypothetical protein